MEDVPDDKLDQVVADLLKECEQNRQTKAVIEDLITILMCAYFLEGIKTRPDLADAIKKKVKETLKQTSIYQVYIKSPERSN